MIIEEFNMYQDVAIKLFNYMNGRVNTLNRYCILEIDMYDFINGTYGNIRYPNHVVLFLGTIVDSWNDEWEEFMPKYDYICTVLSWVIAHELSHADQLISMINYTDNPSYKAIIEGETNKASYDWVRSHSREISCVGNFKCVINNISTDHLPDGGYKKASVKEFYLQTIANIVIRDLDVFRDLELFSDDKKYDTIILDFNSTDCVTIKSDGSYIPENVNIFSDIVYKYAGYWDTYSIDIKILANGSTAILKFIIKDQIINAITMSR